MARHWFYRHNKFISKEEVEQSLIIDRGYQQNIYIHSVLYFFLFNKVLSAQEIYNLYHFNNIEINNFGQYIRAKITKSLRDLEKTIDKKIVSLSKFK